MRAAFIAVVALAGCMTTPAEAPHPRYAGIQGEYYADGDWTTKIYLDETNQRALVVFPPDKATSASEVALRARLGVFLERKFPDCGLVVPLGTLITETTYEFSYLCSEKKAPIRYCVTEAECQTSAAQGIAVDRSFVGGRTQNMRLFSNYAAITRHPSEELLLVAMTKYPNFGVRDDDFVDIAKSYLRQHAKGCSLGREKHQVDYATRVYSVSCS